MSINYFIMKRIERANSILILLAIVDNGFLISLLIISLKHFDINIFDKFIMVCKATVFFTYAFSFLSSW